MRDRTFVVDELLGGQFGMLDNAPPLGRALHAGNELAVMTLTSSLGSWHSTNELLPPMIKDNYNKNIDLMEI